ncbi:endonuclease/exonuclease/phosphatase family protein [Streptomyces olivoreticuli]|uniref:endonuclease/exonuclease/phosphatase family protein n=1 Tax=Streptomyces olivoreticuli TaxID=68246 RepID=UPI002657CD38|nr:endonuclease/exonuclease/phosphatase family protein [Streptomyces olivoreticuli]WKK24251.1 endonuclease/exonuclease/phosphatase family protein [Streptomyces olivoreticuli]
MNAMLDRAGDAAGARPATGSHPESGTRNSTGVWRRGRWVAAIAVLCAGIMLGHPLVPNGSGNFGSLLETFLPWLGASVPVLLVLAVVRRSLTAGAAVLLPAVVWCSLFGGMLTDKRTGGGDMSVVSHNVSDQNTDPGGTARALAASGADVIALEELSSRTAPVYERELADSYPYHSVQGTVGLWSKHPLRNVQPVAIMPWTRALRATIDTPKGPLAIYAAHLASVRLHPSTGFITARRNEAATKLADAVRAEPLPRVVVVGDFNGTTDDTALRPLTTQLQSAQETAGDGFGFSWPAAFPVARIDQILLKGVTPVSSWTLPRTGSDHLPVAAALRL